MKKLFYLLPALAAVVLMAACDKTPNPETPDNGTEQTNEPDWNYFRGSVYVGNLNDYGEEMKEAIEEFFPLITSDMASAKVVIVGESDIKAKTPALLKAIANDAFIVFPAYEGVKEDVAALGVDMNTATVEGDDYYPLLYCYNNYGMGYTYTMWVTEDDELEELESTWSQADWNALVEANKEYESEDEEAVEWGDYILSYYEARLASFVEWLEDAVTEQAQTKSAFVTDVKGDLEQLGQRCYNSVGYSLYKRIDRAPLSDPDNLWGAGSVDLDIRVFPVYKQKTNLNQAGDYYIVVSRVVPHNENMWHPENHAHGGCRNRVYGYWFHDMDVVTSLVNADGSAIANSDIDFFERPIPENKNQSMQYSTGKTVSLGGSLNAGVGDVAGNSFGGGVSFGGTWSSSTSYALETIEYTVNTSSPSSVKYHYYTNNVKLVDDMDKIDDNYPRTARSDFYANTNWAWHVGAAKDNDTQQYKIQTKIDITYASWYHWRGLNPSDSNKRTYPISIPQVSWTLGAPNRVPWGVIALKNASTYEMAHVNVYDSNNKKVDVLTNSFSKNQVAKVSLPVGTYSIHFDLVDGTTQRTYASYVYKDVEVKQGGDEASATVEISTVDAEKQ